MADVQKAIMRMLHQEDDTLSGVITDVKNDHGGTTRYGLTAKFHPKLVELGFFSPDMPAEQALPLAIETYDEEYARPLRLAELTSDALAFGLLSFCVVDGIGTGVRLLRAVIYTLGYTLPVTSKLMDAATVAAAQDCDEKQLVAGLVARQKARCAQIVADSPSQAKFLKGWNNRADQVLALVQ